IINQITLIFSMRNEDPDAAASQLMALKKFLEVNDQNIYEYISKEDFDAIIAKQPSAVQMQMQQMQMMQQAQDTAMQAEASGEQNVGPTDATEGNMTQDGTNALQPQNPNEVARPQSPLGAAVDASMGRAANLPVFGGN